MGLEDLIIGFVAGACGSLVLWLTVGRVLTLKYAGESFLRAIETPTDRTKLALNSLMSQIWIWFWTPQIGKGENEDGSPRLIAPAHDLASEAGRFMLQRVKSAAGVNARQVNAMKDDLLEDLGPQIGAISPKIMKRLEKDHSLIAAAVEVLGPFFKQSLNKGGGNTGSW